MICVIRLRVLRQLAMRNSKALTDPNVEVGVK